MTDLEKRALDALDKATLGPGAVNRRFFVRLHKELSKNPELKITRSRAIGLWARVDWCGRRIADDELRKWARKVCRELEFPKELDLPGDHYERPKSKPKPTRLEKELERGKGRLVL